MASWILEERNLLAEDPEALRLKDEKLRQEAKALREAEEAEERAEREQYERYFNKKKAWEDHIQIKRPRLTSRRVDTRGKVIRAIVISDNQWPVLVRQGLDRCRLVFWVPVQ